MPTSDGLSSSETLLAHTIQSRRQYRNWVSDSNNPRAHSSNLHSAFHVPTVSAPYWKPILNTNVKVENLSEVLLPVLVAHAVDVPASVMEVAAKLG